MSTKLLVIQRTRKLEEERKVLRNRRPQATRAKVQKRVCVSVVVVQAIVRKIRHVLQSENNVGTVESKDILLQFAKVGRNKEQV